MIEILMSDVAERCKGIHHFKGKPLQMIILMVPSITSRLSKKDNLCVHARDSRHTAVSADEIRITGICELNKGQVYPQDYPNYSGNLL